MEKLNNIIDSQSYVRSMLAKMGTRLPDSRETSFAERREPSSPTLRESVNAAPVPVPAGDSAESPRYKTAAPELPRAVTNFLLLLQSHFPTARDGRDWDAHDTRDYGRQVIGIGGEMIRGVFALLRDRHTFRPSVAEVRAAVETVTGKESAFAVPAYAIAAYRDAATLRAESTARRDGDALRIAGTGESDTRQKARERIRALGGWRDSGRRADTERFNLQPPRLSVNTPETSFPNVPDAEHGQEETL